MTRAQHRKANGRWRKTTLQDFGVRREQINQEFVPMVCRCGYGADGQWVPLMLAGICPACRGTDKTPYMEVPRESASDSP